MRPSQLTGVDIVVCLLLPLVGFVAGLLRLGRGDPTAGRMLTISGFMLLFVTLVAVGVAPRFAGP